MMSDSTKTIQIFDALQNPLQKIRLKGKTNLLEALNANQISISQSCEGNGSCTTCRVIVINGINSLSIPTELEAEHSIERKFDPNERLACQTEVLDSVEIIIPNHD